MVGRRILILGRVQGVGFRQHVLSYANLNGITGEVWNRRDGSVECLAFGSKEALLALENAIWLGPGFVAEVHVTVAGVQDCDDFRIGPTR